MRYLAELVMAGAQPDGSGGRDGGPCEPWIPTFTGRMFHLVAPDPRDVSIRDIAHSLSLQCRFGGHCQRFYSLAEHSLLLSRMVERELALCALLHDAAQAYVQDIVPPLRRLLGSYQELAEGIRAAVVQRFRLPSQQLEAITKAEERLWATEVEYLLLPTARPVLRGVEPYPLEALGLSHARQLGLLPREANRRFLERFAELAV